MRASTSRTIKITVPGPFTRPARPQRRVLRGVLRKLVGYAEAPVCGSPGIFAAGRTSCNSTEPYCRPAGRGTAYGRGRINRAWTGDRDRRGASGFGYARSSTTPGRLSFLPELRVQRVIDIIETRSPAWTAVVLARGGRQDNHPACSVLDDLYGGYQPGSGDREGRASACRICAAARAWVSRAGAWRDEVPGRARAFGESGLDDADSGSDTRGGGR